MKTGIGIFAILSTFLTACSTPIVQPTEEKVRDPNALSQGIMQPVNDTGAMEGSFGWGTEIEATPMPETMK